MQNVIEHIVNFDQVASIKERYIGCGTRNLIDLYEMCEKSNEPGALINIDFEKAFDSVEWNFMYAVLKRFNFGNNFIKWIRVLYTEPKFRVKNNGWVSKSYSMSRGMRQGCPVSCLNFILVAEVLGLLIRQSKNVKGIKVGKNEHKIIQYADDATICVSDCDSVVEAY